MSEPVERTDDSYITAGREASAELVIEKSRFIAYVKPVSGKEEAQAFIAEIREKHRDATHNVPAYVIGETQNVMWSSEDGEPQGTAGAPVLRMMVQEGLTDVCIVITRYFGGIKLGTGGLVRAYTKVAKEALSEAGRALVTDMLLLRVSCDYKAFNRVRAMDLGEGARIDNVSYLDLVEFDIIMKQDMESFITGLLSDATNGGFRVLKKKIVKNKIMC